MPETGYDSILTVWSWNTIPWWLIAGVLFGAAMLIFTIVNFARREPRLAAFTAIVAVASAGGAIIAYLLLPGPISTTETTRVIAEGTITEATRADGDEPTLRVRLDTDPTWVLIFHGDDVNALDGETGIVTAQCDWGSDTMDCTTEITGPARPGDVPWWADHEDKHAQLLPITEEEWQ